MCKLFKNKKNKNKSILKRGLKNNLALTKSKGRPVKNYNWTNPNKLEKTREKKHTNSQPNENPVWKQDSRPDEPTKNTRIVNQSKTQQQDRTTSSHDEKAEPLETSSLSNGRNLIDRWFFYKYDI